MKIVFGGHYQQVPEGWVSIPEPEQDLSKRLNQQDNSIDVIFTEHVCEHLSMEDCIFFMKESFRCLKKGGTFRIAMPTIDKLIKFENNELGKHYSDVQTRHYYPNEDRLLKELGLDGIREEPIVFMLDSLFKGHHHKLLWTSELVYKVLNKIGFSDVHIVEPGETYWDRNDCLERTIRGVEPNYVLGEFGLTKFDPETKVVEAKK